MQTRLLGDIEVSEIGIGCMAFSHGYGKIPKESYSIEAIQGAYKHGCNFFDTAEIYSPNLMGRGHNERIVENLDAAQVDLTDVEFAELEEALAQCRIYGHRGFSGF